MSTGDSITEARKRREEQKRNALEQLSGLATGTAELERPVFFVPGWTDEECTCWETGYRKGYTPIKEWIPQAVKNPELVRYVEFTEAESKECRSFLDFAELVKGRVWREIGKKKAFDLVGHSMGGLDSVAAITDEDEPLLNVTNLITVATPHQGSELGEVGAKIRDYPFHHGVQCVNLDPDELPIQEINKLERRKALLGSVGKLYCLMGSRDMVVMGSARFDTKGLPASLCAKKMEVIEIDGATHSQEYGITQDPRVILNIIHILLDTELEKPKKNYGFIYRKA